MSKQWQFDLKLGGNLPYVVSLSPYLRWMSQNMSSVLDGIKRTAYGTACQAETHPTLKKEIQEDPNYVNSLVMRQIDIKDDDGKIIFRCFVAWNKEHNCWHVLMELPEENCFKAGKGNL